MNKVFPTLLFCFAIILVNAQVLNQPFIGTATIIPSSPTPNDIIKIATFVSTPNQGIVVDQINHAVSQNPNEIKIKGCYWQGLATAIQEYRDTLIVGQLPPGIYTIKHKAYLSSTQQHCSATDSNEVVMTFTVSGITGLNVFEKNEEIFYYPNPVKEVITFKNKAAYSKGTIYSISGSLITEFTLDSNNAVGVKALPAGMYFIWFLSKDVSEAIKFIKED
jgi:hypothetical protein